MIRQKQVFIVVHAALHEMQCEIVYNTHLRMIAATESTQQLGLAL